MARVGETEITQEGVAVAETLSAGRLSSMAPAARISQVVDNLIDLKLVVQAVEEGGIRDDLEYLRRVEFLADQTLGQIYIERRLAEAVSDAAVRQEYDRVIPQTPPFEEIRPRHNLVGDRETAEAVITRPDAGDGFAALEAEISQDGVSGKQGGDLGYVEPETVVKEIGEAAAKLEVGGYTSEPVESAFGFHVVKLEDRRQRPVLEFVAVGTADPPRSPAGRATGDRGRPERGDDS